MSFTSSGGGMSTIRSVLIMRLVTDNLLLRLYYR